MREKFLAPCRVLSGHELWGPWLPARSHELRFNARRATMSVKRLTRVVRRLNQHKGSVGRVAQSGTGLQEAPCRTGEAAVSVGLHAAWAAESRGTKDGHGIN